MFVPDDGLRQMLTQLAVHVPAALMRAPKTGVGGGPVELTRKEIVQIIFKLCDEDRDGLLNDREMRTFAAQTGLGDAEEVEWKDEYSLLCMDNGADPAQGISVQLLEKMCADQGDSGCYCTDEELRSIKGGLEMEAKQRAMRASVHTPERIGLIHDAFKALDADKDGKLSQTEMWGVVAHLGFKGDAERYAEEYQLMCANAGPPDLDGMGKLVNDMTDKGWYCSDEDLRAISKEPRKPPPTPAMPTLPTTSSGAVAKSGTTQAQPATRNELVTAVFHALCRSSSSSGETALGEAEMKRFAVFTGFDGTAEEWSQEFKLICSEGGAGRTTVDLGQFRKLVDDEGDGGCYCGNGELKDILKDLEKEAAS